MNFNDVQKVNLLSNEKLAIQRAIIILNGGGRITAMTVSGGSRSDWGADPVLPTPGGSFFSGNTATVQTTYITYPPQMVDAIKLAFDVRLQQITDDLVKLGVTL